MTDGDVRDELTPAERRLVALLALLKTEDGDGSGLSQAVLRRARWQLVVRDLARSFANVAVAVGHGVAILMGASGRRPRR